MLSLSRSNSESTSVETRGDLHHPATVISTNSGFISASDLRNRFISDFPLKPEYSPNEYLSLALRVELSGASNADGLQIPIKSHLNLEAWKELLADFSDPWVVKGVTYGWPLGIDRTLPTAQHPWPNHNSCDRFMPEVNEFFTKEVSHGAVFPLGPTPSSLPAGSTSIPILTVPKDTNKRRVCGDASFPPGLSLNDSIPDTTGLPAKMRLPTIWDLLVHVKEIGKDDCLLAKIDWSRGYRQIPIDPRDALRQIFWLPQAGFLLDTKGVFGVKSMASIQQRTHQGVLAAAHSLTVEPDPKVVCHSSSNPSYRATLPYIDDGLVAVHRSVAEQFWGNILTVFAALNVHTSTTPAHICAPARKMTALGFLVDLDAGTIEIPKVKMMELQAWLLYVRGNEFVTFSEIKKLLGRIMRVSMVVECGRRFINRILTLLKVPNNPGMVKVKVTQEAAADLNWWLYTAPSLNHRCVIEPMLLPVDNMYEVDGRGRLESGEPPAVGGLFPELKQFFSQHVPLVLAFQPIHVIEAVAFLAAARTWISFLPPGSRAVVGSDSRPVVDSVNFGRPKDPSLQAATRLIWHLHAIHQVQLDLVYVNTKVNRSDPLSRLDEGFIAELLADGWTRLSLPDSSFSLSETL